MLIFLCSQVPLRKFICVKVVQVVLEHRLPVSSLRSQESPILKSSSIFTAEKKKLELAEKYKTLKSDGKLEKYLSKKRKRNAAKDRRHLPKVRTQNS